jgi:hypothetical protein
MSDDELTRLRAEVRDLRGALETACTTVRALEKAAVSRHVSLKHRRSLNACGELDCKAFAAALATRTPEGAAEPLGYVCGTRGCGARVPGGVTVEEHNKACPGWPTPAAHEGEGRRVVKGDLVLLPRLPPYEDQWYPFAIEEVVECEGRGVEFATRKRVWLHVNDEGKTWRWPAPSPAGAVKP